jgi:hypothetical protein
MGFTAVMARSGSGSGFGVPLEDLQFVRVALNHEPVNRVRTFGAANLASILCDCRHDEAFLKNKSICPGIS